MNFNKYSMLLGGLLMLTTSMFAQQSDVYKKVDQMPVAEGCQPGDMGCHRQKMIEYVQSHIEYPAAAKKAEKGGVVFVTFVVEKNGKVADVRTVKDPGDGLGPEAVRVVESMNKEKFRFVPGEEDGKKVKVELTLPVTFNYGAIKMQEKAAREAADAKNEDADQSKETDKIFETVAEMPKFLSCDSLQGPEAQNCTFNGIVQHLQGNLMYPSDAKADSINGTVLLSFVVEKDGSTKEVKVENGLHEACDEEAKRVVSTLPKWIPGQQNGQAVRVRMKLPVQFRI